MVDASDAKRSSPAICYEACPLQPQVVFLPSKGPPRSDTTPYQGFCEIRSAIPQGCAKSTSLKLGAIADRGHSNAGIRQ